MSDKVRTPLLDVELRQLIIDEHTKAYGAPPSDSKLELFWSQLALEHGAGGDKNAPFDGRAAWELFCCNFGNRRGIDGDAGSYQMTAEEIIGGHSVPVAGKWPAYSTAAEGMRTWLAMMKAHYATAWACADKGDAPGYVSGLKCAGYFTASETIYYTGLRAWLSIYRRRTWPDDESQLAKSMGW